MTTPQGRPPKYERDIGPEILAARRAGTCWKLLVREYGHERQQLWRLMKRAEREEASRRARGAKMFRKHPEGGHGATLLG